VRTRLAWLLAASAVLGSLVAGFVDHRPRALVDWRSLRAVALESDDWGLPGYVPDAHALDGVDRAALGGTHFPDVYWNSTLESAADLDAMVALMRRHHARDGLPAVFQPNMILKPQLPGPDSPYHRPGLAEAERRAVASGTWQPEIHGADHIDPARRDEALTDPDPVLAQAASRGVLVFPRSHTAFELGPQRPLADVRRSWEPLPRRFEDRFGQPATAVIAPDYVWDGRHEGLFRDLGLRIVQAKDHQRQLGLVGPQHWRDVRRLALRLWDRWRVRDLVYLDRNAFFETAHAEDPRALVRSCADQVRGAWRRGEPAIVETHRVGFVQVEPGAGAEGRALLDSLLTDLDASAPLYVSDAELAGLARRGISAVRRGPVWVLRNPGPAHRLAILPTDGPRASPARIGVPARTTLVLDRTSLAVLQRLPLR